VNELKKKLRAQLRTAHSELTVSERNIIDTGLIERLLGHDLYQNCKRIFLFASAGYEINTHKLIDIAFQQGKIVALPKCLAGGVMNFYRFSGELEEGKFHILEPVGDEILYPERNDLMIVPGLAFDECGYRIGQGGGYYDRYLADHLCTCIGLCREQFLMKEIPISWNDIPVDFVITEDAVYNCINKRSFG